MEETIMVIFTFACNSLLTQTC